PARRPGAAPGPGALVGGPRTGPRGARPALGGTAEQVPGPAGAGPRAGRRLVYRRDATRPGRRPPAPALFLAPRQPTRPDRLPRPQRAAAVRALVPGSVWAARMEPGRRAVASAGRERFGNAGGRRRSARLVRLGLNGLGQSGQ